MIPYFRSLFLNLLVTLALLGCTPVMAPYSAEAYKTATTLKAQSLALVARSDQSFAPNAADVAALMTDTAAAYEYARGLPQNQVTAEQWRRLRDPEGGLLGGFMAKWQREDSVSPFTATESAALIAAAFDEIICLEVNKAKASSCSAAQPGVEDA